MAGFKSNLSDLQSIKNTFIALDQDGNGTLSKEELIEFKGFGDAGIEQTDWQTILQSCD